MVNEAIPPHMMLKGEDLAESIDRPILSCLEPTQYFPLPNEVRETLMPSPDVMTENRLARHRFLVEQTAEKRLEVERLLGRSFDDRENLKIQLDDARKEAKMAMRLPQINADTSISEAEQCRFRDITILECLTQVCVDQKEYIPIWGNWQASVAEPLNVDHGMQPAFTITDCVTPGNGYTASDGWIAVSATVRTTQAVFVYEVGMNFAGNASYDIDGDEDLIGSNDWGAISIGSSLVVRSAPTNGPFVDLVGPASWNFEVVEKNDSGLVAPMPFMPNNRSVSVNRDVNDGHTFIVDYILDWDVTRSDDYWASSCFALSKFVIKPYILYKSCHSEYQEVARLFDILPTMIPNHPIMNR